MKYFLYFLYNKSIRYEIEILDTKYIDKNR